MAKARFQNVKMEPESVDGTICNFNFRAFRNIVVGKRVENCWIKGRNT